MKKICSKCDNEKTIEEFYINKKTKDGYYTQCKLCISKYRENNKDAKKEHNRKYRENNKEKINQYKKEHNTKHKEYMNEYNKKNKDKIKQYNEDNKDRLKEYKKQYELDNKEQRKEYFKKYRSENKYKIREYQKYRQINDSEYRFRRNIRALIYDAFTNNGYSKNSKTFNIIGCSYDEFKEYIINQFEPWMTLENHGIYTGNYNETWQLDHIIPISNATTEEEVIKLNHYTNLRPLCSRKNLEKSNKNNAI